MNKTSIEWTDYTWNPVTGCTKVSAGCKNCYAERMANRFKKTHGDFKQVKLHPERLRQPLTKKVPVGTRVFVCDVSDLFHKEVPFDFIRAVFLAMNLCRHITFQILTKRPERALEFSKAVKTYSPSISWPLPNVWIGTSCENQETANERIPQLICIEAAKLFLSCEPLLGPIDFEQIPTPRVEKYVDCLDKSIACNLGLKKIHYIDWIIAGGESGPGARPLNPYYVRLIRDQCESAHIPFFFKQWGEFLVEEHNWGTIRVGKSKSGNVLDGKQHLQFPQ